MPTDPAHEATIPANALWRQRGLGIRLRGLAVALPILAVLAVAIYLCPARDGTGTHQQLGLVPCTFMARTGWPCPSCGLTTSFSATMHGQVALAFRAQPAGPLLVLGLLGLLAVATAELITGRNYLLRRRFRWRWLWLIVVVVALGWAVKAGVGCAQGRFPLH